MTDQYVATCWGGPYDGETIAATRTVLAFVYPASPLRLSKLTDPSDDSAIGVRHGTYTLEKLFAAGGTYRVWVIKEPAEHREAVMERLLDGATAIATLCSFYTPKEATG